MQLNILFPVFLAMLAWRVAADTAISLPRGPIQLSGGAIGAAFQLTTGDSRAYYLSVDGAIHELAGNGDPERSIRYNDIVRVPTFKVKGESPIAVAASYVGPDLKIRIYFIGPDNNLKEYCFFSGGWTDCALTAARFAVKPGSKYLYAATTSNSDHTRVGYQCVNGNLCEAYYYNDNKWRTREL